MPRQPTCECGECRRCKHRAYMRGWYERKTPAERRAWTARRDKELIRERDRKRGGGRGRKPPAHHVRANRAVYRAKKKGLLVPEPCLFCDDPVVVAHHHDYDLPLEVTWLCRHHHGRVHV